MRLEFSFIYSTLLHIAFALLLVLLPNLIQSGATPPPGQETVEVTIVEPKPAPKDTGNLILPPKKDKAGKPTEPGPGDLKPGEDESDAGERLEKQLTITNYIDRIKLIIDPIWYSMVKERLDHLRRRGERIRRLQVEVTIHVSSGGAINKRWVSRSCGRADFDNYATKAFDLAGQLPPPPSNLLENNILVLFWDFNVNTP